MRKVQIESVSFVHGCIQFPQVEIWGFRRSISGKLLHFNKYWSVIWKSYKFSRFIYFFLKIKKINRKSLYISHSGLTSFFTISNAESHNIKFVSNRVDSYGVKISCELFLVILMNTANNIISITWMAIKYGWLWCTVIEWGISFVVFTGISVLRLN